MIAALSMLMLTFSAVAQDTKAQEEKKARLEREIEIIDKQLADNASKTSDILNKLTLIRKKVANRKSLILQSDRQIRKYNDDIYLKQLEINKLTKRIKTLTDHYEKLVLSAYKNRDPKVWYMYMLASDNLGQAFRRFNYFKNMSSEMKDEAKEIRRLKEELEEDKAEIQTMKKQAELVKAQRAEELLKLEKEEDEADRMSRQLQVDKKKYQKELNEKKKQVEAVNKEIKRLIEAAMKSKSADKSRKTEVDQALSKEFAGNKGKLPWPADGPVVGKYGQHYHPVYKNLKLPMNHGIDIALAKGTKVLSVFDGVVADIAVMTGYNQCVIVQHGNYFTFYSKIKNVKLKKGDKVKIGQVIGEVDTIDGQTQLNFQLWKGVSSENPENWLKK